MSARSLWRRIHLWVTARRRERDLQDEIRLHLDLSAEDHRKAGLPPKAAEAAARRDFGSIELTKEVCRDERGFPWLDTLRRDLYRSVVALRRTPTATAAIVLTLAIGIGATVAIFSIVDGVLLKRPPVSAFDRLVMVWETDRSSGTTREPGSLPDFLDYRERARTLDALGGLLPTDVSVALPGSDAARLAAVHVSAGTLTMMGVQPVTGRLFTASEQETQSETSPVLISSGLWLRSFNRDPNVIGSVLHIDERPRTIVGVVPDRSDFGLAQILSASVYGRGFVDRGNPRVDVWVPLRATPEELPRSTHPLLMLGRLAPGTSSIVAQQELAGIASDLERAYPENEERGVFVERLDDVVFGPTRPSLLLLLGAVGLVLLVACANVANLLLARGIRRGREIAVQLALGAARYQIARQFVLEGVLITVVGAALGVALAVVGVKALVAVAPATLPRILDVSVDARALGATLAVCLAAGIFFALVPTIQARGVDLQSSLTSASGRSGASSEHLGRRLRSAIIVGELALTVMLLVGASLLIRSMWALERVDPGFQASGVLKAEYQLPESRYPASRAAFPEFPEIQSFTARMLERVGRLGGVESVAAAANHPLDPGFTNSFVIVGREAESRNWPELSIRRVTPGYFTTVGMRLVRGRLLEDGDTSTATPVLVINQSAARRFFGATDPIGAQIRYWGVSRRIVGVVGDEHTRGLTVDAPLAAYMPLAQAPGDGGALLVRTARDPGVVMNEVRSAMREIDPGVPVFAVEPLEETVWRSLSERRFVMVLLVLFATTALALAAVGVYGIFQYSVEQRTREIGIRAALGAQPGQTLRLLLGQGVTFVVAGLTIGLFGAALLTRTLQSLLFEVAPTDPLSFVAVSVMLAFVALAATLASSRSALKVDPLVALRSD